jgi:hypothetical protein
MLCRARRGYVKRAASTIASGQGESRWGNSRIRGAELLEAVSITGGCSAWVKSGLFEGFYRAAIVDYLPWFSANLGNGFARYGG